MPTWNPSLALGIRAIDQQHEELFRWADALLEAIAVDRASIETQALLEFLDGYCKTHFSAEEMTMRQMEYPEFLPHQSEHRHFIHALDAIRQRLEGRKSEMDVANALHKLVAGWLVDHVSRVDRRLAVFLKAPRPSAP